MLVNVEGGIKCGNPGIPFVLQNSLRLSGKNTDLDGAVGGV